MTEQTSVIAAPSRIRTTRRRLLQGVGLGVAGGLGAPALIGRALAAGRTLKIGFVSPETGPIAAFGAADNFVLANFRAAMKEGITVNGITYPVVVIARDSQSNPTRAGEVAAGLIQSDKVDIMVATSSAVTTNPVADQCEVNGVPCVTTDTPWEAHFFGRNGNPQKGFDWTYHFFWGLKDALTSYTGMWNSIATNKRVGMLFANDADGVAIGDKLHGMPPLVDAAGFHGLDLGLFTPMSGDFTAQISKLKDGNCDIVTGVFNPPDFTTFWNQCAQQNFHPKAVTIAKALLFPSSPAALGERGYGLSTEEWWSASHPFTSSLNGMSAAEYCAAYSHATGLQWTQPMGFKHAVLEVAVDALRRSKNPTKPEAIRDAIAGTSLNTIVGPISWQHGPLRNITTTPLTGGQWVKGKVFKYDLVVVNNDAGKMIPVQQAFQPLI